MKILVVSTLGRQLRLFEAANLQVLAEAGFEVHAAADFSDPKDRFGLPEGVRRHQLPIGRSPLAPGNVAALVELIRLLRREQFDAVHAHSPVGGVLGRLAARWTGVPMVLYTAHGFHFFTGSSLLSWLVFYPVERLLARWTDVLITMNAEDTARARRFRSRVVEVPGIGVDTAAFRVDANRRASARAALGLAADDVAVVTIGELIPRKNLATLLSAIEQLPNRAVLLVCGTGKLEDELRRQASGSSARVRFLGYRCDIAEVLAAGDVYATASFQEGLPVSVIEAMAAGLPVVGSAVRGIRDLVDPGNGRLCAPGDPVAFASALSELVNDQGRRAEYGRASLARAGDFDRAATVAVMREVYATIGTRSR